LNLVYAYSDAQLQESEFGEWFEFDPHFYVMDCRLSRDREMDSLKDALVACHRVLSSRPAEVPKICSMLLEKLKGLRKQHSSNPIITAAELLQAAIYSITPKMLAQNDMSVVCDNICR
jgi:hypothetical protein